LKLSILVSASFQINLAPNLKRRIETLYMSRPSSSCLASSESQEKD